MKTKRPNERGRMLSAVERLDALEQGKAPKRPRQDSDCLKAFECFERAIAACRGER
jgi:hypothetical protein